MSVLVFIEADNGVVKKSSLEAVAYGSKVGAVTVVAMGSIEASELAKVGNYGAEKVLHCSDDRLNDGVISATAKLIAEAVGQSGAETVVMSRSSLVDAVAARVAIKIGASVVTNVQDLPDTSNGFVVKRGVFTGKAFAFVSVPDGKKVITVTKNVVQLEPTSSEAAIEEISVAFDDADFGVKRIGVHKQEGDILLPEADLVVSAGRGMKGPENWQMIEDLATTLGAATACSKPVSDMDWRPHHEHVGQTGIKVAPQLYIAVGISGAIQHLAGVNSSKVIVAINKDPEAPFFKAADYGVVGDAFEVVPKLIEAIKK
ncbi:electron transfer flavoprotein subunit alpha/FixB family protein [Flammeovirga kamogawensis]|uniref:Electron transfer flavoprotein subunit alpha/FixB family protein n=1 Tax=Flammeovirga kamogawensis TaxID=373891 RepID=A0ABX8GUD1_9BACT|nr:electron transfer flavoprotein subunit alpha/FixB family protein [Flammeovirga kamogawensis]MBB6459928.1 electron transfer flavoprotein alpha subunit [Flammeovirga kamogawensis]QWG07019.1 electron transfer flavoprotein subunit alpha/FixB family protein [Flammeovirga kamogawensis]TRX68840.1 electron transfer flavoprotein subunit alpha/FixB family protein [Flammeovirga kamogawensis]